MAADYDTPRKLMRNFMKSLEELKVSVLMLNPDKSMLMK
jgi:hypothetical protein